MGEINNSEDPRGDILFSNPRELGKGAIKNFGGNESTEPKWEGKREGTHEILGGKGGRITNFEGRGE